jgi:hypothetical protein
MHIAGNDQLLTKPTWALAPGEKVGNNSGGLAAVRYHGVGEYAHQADRTAAIDKPHVVFGENFAKLTSRFAENRLRPYIRSAIDANRINFAHGLILIEEYMWRRFSPPASAFCQAVFAKRFLPRSGRAMPASENGGLIKNSNARAAFP